MTPSQIVDKILASGNFQRKSYAKSNDLHARDNDELLDEVALHLERQDMDFLSMLFEANCESEAMNWYNEAIY